jgi:asparagine synthase (glutamine-hydrolysing)
MLLFLARLLPHHLVGKLGRRASAIHWRIDFLKTASFSDLYRYLVSHHKQPETFVRGGREPETCFGSLHGLTEDEQDRLMSLLDVMTYLPDDILTKVDRAGMAVGLETRVPLLDHRVVAFAASLPMCLKVRNGKGKWLLRKVLSRYVPERLFDRPKMGFGVPIEHWLRNELREWCESLLDPRRIREQGYIDDRFVTRMWNEYLSGQNNWHYYLWDVLMFQAWLAENR